MLNVDLTALNRLINELNLQFKKLEEAKTNGQALDYEVELGKTLGLAALVSQEAGLLVGDMYKIYSGSSAMTMANASGNQADNPFKSIMEMFQSKSTKKN